MEKPKLVFEFLQTNGGSLGRAKVPGGWLILCSGVAFYPDPKHEWNGGSLP